MVIAPTKPLSDGAKRKRKKQKEKLMIIASERERERGREWIITSRNPDESWKKILI
jgi:hypothetical protein